MIDEKGGLQGPQPVLAGHQRRALAADGGKEAGDLRLQGIDLRIDALLQAERRRSRRGGGIMAEDPDPALDEIDGGAGTSLKDPHLPLVSEADAAHGQIGHAAVLELDAAAGHVVGGGDHRGAHGMGPFDGRLHQAEDQIEIVDHQIEYGAHRLAPRREMPHAGGLDEERPVDQGRQRPAHGGETLDMADLQDLAPRRGEADQLAGIRHRRGDRFFDQDMGTMLDEIPGDLEMARRRCRDADRVHPAEKRPVVAEPLDPMLGGDRRRARRIPVHHRHEPGALEARIFAGMVLAEMADTDHGCPELSHDSLSVPFCEAGLVAASGQDPIQCGSLRRNRGIMP